MIDFSFKTNLILLKSKVLIVFFPLERKISVLNLLVECMNEFVIILFIFRISRNEIEGEQMKIGDFLSFAG